MATSRILEQVDTTLLVRTILTLTALYVVQSLCIALYNITWHPLAKYPGPVIQAAFYFPDVLSNISGESHIRTKALHDKYGNVVRIKPDALSYKSAQAWKDIYGLKPDRTDHAKDPRFHRKIQCAHIITACPQDEHTRFRKVLAPAFSDKALQEQESMLNVYFDLLVEKLTERLTDPGKSVVDMAAYYNFTTFDIIGDLVFDAPFGCLDGGEYHSFIQTAFASLKAIVIARAASMYPIVRLLLGVLARLPSATDKRRAFFGFTQEKVHARLDRETDRKDIMSYILNYNSQTKDVPLSLEEIEANARILLIAGSETSATHLSGATYLLLTHPQKLQRLQSEVRSAFSSPDEIDLKSVSDEASLPYLNAVIKETFRFYPSVPVSFPRITGPEGGVIDGQYVPAHTQIGVHQWSAYHSKSNFAAPDEFHPERWLANEASEMFQNDHIAALQPFLVGPRSCLGKSLAYFEIKSILVRVLWHFDMELQPASRIWLKQKEYDLWEKLPLWVKLTQRKC